MDRDVMSALSMILHIGISILVPIFLCVAVGAWMEERWGRGWMLALLVLGILAGGRNAWILAKKTAQNQKQEYKEETYDLMADWKGEERDGEET